jgi:DNA-binding MarR family transcriptional regulator
MDVDARRELKVLDAIAQDGRTTQRSLASHVGIALGLANLYLKRLIRKGYVKCVNVQANRVRYLITPKGIAQKTRLTYEFMEYSLHVFREGRNHLKMMLAPYTAAAGARIAICGTGEAAELAYLCLRELELEPAAVFDGPGHLSFFGIPVRAIEDTAGIQFDALIVATFSDPTALIADLVQRGIARDRMIMLREPVGAPSRPRVEAAR